MPLLLLTKRETATYLRVSVSTIDKLRAEHALRAIKVGGRLRFPVEALEEFIKANTENSEKPGKIRMPKASTCP